MHLLQEMLQAYGETFNCCPAYQHEGRFLLSEHGGLINIKVESEFKAQEKIVEVFLKQNTKFVF